MRTHEQRRKASRIFLVALVGLTILGNVPVAQAAVKRIALTKCRTAPVGPATGVWFGVNHDWGSSTLAQYAQRLGHAPALAGNYVHLPLRTQDVTYLNAAAEQVRQNRGSLLVTVEPHEGLAAVTPTAISALVTLLKNYNDMGVQVLVRYAHEMNGNWYPWAQDPAPYLASYRAVAKAVHFGAKCSAMAWTPNYGGSYPFAGGQYSAPAGSARAKALDTNGDGQLTKNDNAYAPYYPGDDAVDWVGLSISHWGDSYPWGRNTVSEAGKLAAMITGTYNGLNGDQRAVADFYADFAVAHRKAFGVFETAALYTPETGGLDAVTVKSSWWQQTYAVDLPARFPRLKLLGWFEWDKYEADANGRVDWTATNDATVRAAYQAALPTWLVFA